MTCIFEVGEMSSLNRAQVIFEAKLLQMMIILRRKKSCEHHNYFVRMF